MIYPITQHADFHYFENQNPASSSTQPATTKSTSSDAFKVVEVVKVQSDAIRKPEGYQSERCRSHAPRRRKLTLKIPLDAYAEGVCRLAVNSGVELQISKPLRLGPKPSQSGLLLSMS